MFEWAYIGVDHNLPGNGGKECVDFIPLWQRVAESGLACIFAACCIKYAYKRITLPDKIPPLENRDMCGKRILLVSMCLTFGIELGFKLATRQFIWIFNPCHVTSMIQINVAKDKEYNDNQKSNLAVYRVKCDFLFYRLAQLHAGAIGK